MKKVLERKFKKNVLPHTSLELEESLRKAAYFRWLERGAPQGDDWQDWFEVENRWRDNIVPENNN